MECGRGERFPKKWKALGRQRPGLAADRHQEF
jgi:hypothetical protein